jgi:hypothetical protein
MSYQFNCTNCGKTGFGSSGSGPAGGTNPPSGWITKWGSTKVYCSNRCKDEYNDRKSGSSGGSGNSEVSETKARAEEAKARAAEAKAQEKAAMFNGLFSAVNADAQEAGEITNYLSKITFSNDCSEIENKLSEIISLWTSGEKFTNSDHKSAVKKAAYERFEFGLMKLESMGQSNMIGFFKGKQKEMKPKKFFGLF